MASMRELMRRPDARSREAVRSTKNRVSDGSAITRQVHGRTSHEAGKKFSAGSAGKGDRWKGKRR